MIDWLIMSAAVAVGIVGAREIEIAIIGGWPHCTECKRRHPPIRCELPRARVRR